MRRTVDRTESAPAIAPRHNGGRPSTAAPHRRKKAVARKQPTAAASGSAASPELPHDISTIDAFQVIAGALADTIDAHRAEVRRRDAAGIHQMRIGLRRMRAAISIFSALVGDRESRRLKREMKWLAGRLAPARDLHVMEMKFASAQTDATLQPFLKRLATDRKRAFDAAKDAVEQTRFRKLLHDLRRWIARGEWTRHAKLDDGLRDARHFARHELTRRGRKLIRKLDDLDQLDDHHRHRVRIAAKKLYYATGFFESLFVGHKGGKKLTRFKKHIKKLLDALGALNDVAVRRVITDRVAQGANGSRRENAGAAEELAELDSKGIHKQMKAALKAAGKLADDPLFGA